MVRPNGVNSTYGYDLAGRLTNINHQGAGGSLLNFNYTLDANGNRTAVTSNAGNESYTLDQLSRLTNVTYGNGDAAVYSYDANGNRLSQTVTPAGGSAATTNYSYDNAGQLLSSGAITYTYDANGNLTAAGGNSYSWDYDNRLSSANVGGIASSYGYDAFGVRTTAVISGLNTSYLWDRLAENPLLLDDGSHAYVYADGPLAQFDSSNNRQYLLTDALNSVRGLSDNTGGLVGTVNYDVFGGVRNQSGATSALGFTGELYNPQTQLLHLRARDYAATLGRLLSVDTVSPNAEVGQGYNVYAYVANNPTTWVDPSGHSASGFAPPYDPGLFVGWKENIASMMQNAVQTFSFSAFGAWALRIGARMGTLATLAGGATAFNVVVGVLAVAAVLAMTYLIYSCLLNQNSWCYKSSTMQGLRGMASAVTIDCDLIQDSEGKAIARGMVGALGWSEPKKALRQSDCFGNPEPKEEDETNQMRVQFQTARNGVTRDTVGLPVIAPAKRGVTVRQVQGALGQLFEMVKTVGWYKNSYDSASIRAIGLVSSDLNRYPPGGISEEHYNIQFRRAWNGQHLINEFPCWDRQVCRVDVENLRGHNLRYLQ